MRNHKQRPCDTPRIDESLALLRHHLSFDFFDERLAAIREIKIQAAHAGTDK